MKNLTALSEALTPTEYLEFILAPAVQEDVQPGEVHSSEWKGVDARCTSLSKADTVKALRSLDYKTDPYAGVPYFTNGFGLEQVYKRFVEKALSTPNKVATFSEVVRQVTHGA